MHYSPLLNTYNGRKLAKLKMLLICQKLFLALKFFMHSNIQVMYYKDTHETLGKVDFTIQVCTISFVWVEALRPSQQFFSHIGTDTLSVVC